MNHDVHDPSQLDRLVIAYATGDHAAFHRLRDAIRPMLLSLLTGMLGQAAFEQILDLEQETWLNIHRHQMQRMPASIVEPQTFRAFKNYTLKAAKNLHLSARRKKLGPISGLDQDVEDTDGTLPSEELEEMRRCLEELRSRSPRDAEIVQSRYLDNVDVASIASQFQLHEGHVRRIVASALMRLLQCMERRYS